MAARTSTDPRGVVNGHHPREALDPGVLARVNALNALEQEDDDVVEVVAEKDAGLSHHPSHGVRATRPSLQGRLSQHEISRLEEKITEAFKARDVALEVASASGGGNECCCPCHDRGQQRGYNPLPNPYARSTKATEGSKGSPITDPKAYDFWADLTALSTRQLAIMCATPPLVGATIIVWAVFLKLL